MQESNLNDEPVNKKISYYNHNRSSDKSLRLHRLIDRHPKPCRYFKHTSFHSGA